MDAAYEVVLAHGSNVDDAGLALVVVALVVAFVLAERASRRQQRERAAREAELVARRARAKPQR